MTVSRTSMNAASETVTAMSQGLAAGRQTARSAPSEIEELIGLSRGVPGKKLESAVRLHVSPKCSDRNQNAIGPISDGFDRSLRQLRHRLRSWRQRAVAVDCR